MKKQYTLDRVYSYDFVVLAINSHSKAYKLCWNLNKQLNTNFEKAQDHQTQEGFFFTRYTSKKEETTYNLLSNRSKKGLLVSSQKNVDYFLIISKNEWKKTKSELLVKLREINDILLVFELELEKINQSERLIIYD